MALVQDGVNRVRYLYVNGVKQPNTAPAQDANGQGELWFGDQNAILNGNPNPNGVDGFAGNLDEVRIYNRALSQSDINNLMADPVLQATSLQASGTQTLGIPLFPSLVPLTEPQNTDQPDVHHPGLSSLQRSDATPQVSTSRPARHRQT